MRQIRETLRLHLQSILSYNEVGRALKISKSVAGKYVSLARVAGVDWAIAQTLTDEELEARLYRPALPRRSYQLTPDFAQVHQELKRAGVTLQLLWEEYAKDNTLAYKYTSFCIKYREWAMGLKRSMRQIHVAGEKLFVDYAGQTMPIIDASTGEITKAQIFVATFGASNYTYACATARQTTADWVGAQIQALEFFGGVPRLIVPDQARALIKNPDRYDPQPNRLYDEFANHYGCALLAARPTHPRDKPKVENAVLVVERWILARLRNRRFFHLAELNQAITQLLVDLNQRAFKKLPGCRRSAFEQLDAPALQPLPAKRFEIFRWKTVKGSSWISQRDHLLFGLMYNTGARVSEIIGVRVADVILDSAVCVHLMGKGRKRRSLPLWDTTVKEVRAWLRLNSQLGPNSVLLPNRDGQVMTRDNVSKRLDIAVQTAAKTIPDLAKRRQISPHTIRHTTAMHMLQSGTPIEEIALWMGHESPTTTHHYVEANLAMKEQALARMQEPDSKIRRYHAPDELLEFLRTL